MKNTISTLSAFGLLAYVAYAGSTPIPDIDDYSHSNIAADGTPYAYSLDDVQLYQQQGYNSALRTPKLCECGSNNKGVYGLNNNDAGHGHSNGHQHQLKQSNRRQDNSQHHGHLQAEHEHERYRDTPFYFHRHGNAHFYPPIAVLGG